MRLNGLKFTNFNYNNHNFAESIFMDAVIKVRISELNAGLIDRIKTLFQGKEDVELTISFDDRQQKYYDVLDRSKKDLEQGNNLVTFTMDELEAYSNNRRA